MPVVRCSVESMALLIAEARELKISVVDLVDNLVYLALGEEEDESEEEEEDESEEEEEE